MQTYIILKFLNNILNYFNTDLGPDPDPDSWRIE
jgi:hypothetical protein